MAIQDKLLVSKEVLNKIKARSTAIKVTTGDKEILKNVSDIIELIDKEIENNSLTLLEKIEKKMKETKRSDPEMNANLYILFRKLSDGKIAESEASALFDMYVSSQPFEKKIY